MFENLIDKFEEGKESKTYRRIDEYHNLDIFIGYNDKNQPTMVFTENGDVHNVESSQYIEVNLYKKVNNKILISFSLLDKSMYQMFLRLCNDIIESSRTIENSRSINFIINRWDSWRRMFKKPISDLLTELQIKGLLGELIFLKKYMILTYGEIKAIDSWLGPNKSHKDFETDNTWYEVKAISPGALTVKISSIEQLDSDLDGQLIVVELEKSTNSIENYISINEYVDKLEESIDDFEARLQLRYKLSKAGYCADESYDRYIYRHIDTNAYLVNHKFPKMNKNSLSKGIVKVSYEIERSFIRAYLIGGAKDELETI